MPSYPRLADDTHVYIAIRNSTYIDPDNHKILAHAFLLRKQELIDGKAHDGDGVSIIVADTPPTTSDIKLLAPWLKSKTCGVDAIRVGDVRELGLDVIQNGVVHGYIKGLPYQYSAIGGDKEKATELAERLALVSKTIHRQP